MKKRFCKFLAVILIIATLTVAGSLSSFAAVITDGTNFYVAGDSNGDGEFDIRDLVHMKKISAGMIDELSPATDFDADGTVSGPDFVVGRKMLLGADSSMWSNVYK